MKFVRWVLGRVILGCDFLTRAKPVSRDMKSQALIDARTANLIMYQFEACPFCVKVRRVIRKQALKIELRDARNEPVHKQELISGGGRYKVPCLRIKSDTGEITWLYESGEILSYLKTEFKFT
ncbi:MAG: glutaredoxin domain-containing protein [Pseudomonadota bacterium]|nr:glutaredoxin domain-containing protein [Pseudomonadota bacterium]